MMNFQVSVIIPLFNAEKYIAEAINSATVLNEIGEAIIVDDGSTDNSLIICQDLAIINPKIKIYQHPDKKNHGRAASRNLGIKQAKCKFIAFLDADDLYLPNRFETDKVVFENNPDSDGVYGATGILFENENAKTKWFENHSYEVTTIEEKVNPEDLFECLLFGGKGHFTTDAITVKKELLIKTGGFIPELKIGEDTNLYLKMAAVGILQPANIKTPIALRRVHECNSVHTKPEIAKKFYKKAIKNIFYWSLHKIQYDTINSIFIAYHKYFEEHIKKSECKLLLELTLKRPLILFSDFFWRKAYQIILKK